MEPTPGSLVQRFSWELDNQPDSPDESYQQLRNDVIEDRDRRARQLEAELRRIQDIFSARRPAKEKLMETMAKFQEHVPAHMRRTAAPSSWEDVEQTIQAVQDEWEAKREASHFFRAKEWLRKVTIGINNHATALKMLPSESEYVSLVSGAVSMIIKASANYSLITESFAAGIVTINDAVQTAMRSGVYDSPLVQQAVLRLYSYVFQYLIHFMSWYTNRSRTRFLKSFNEDLSRLFDADLVAVKEASQHLAMQIQLRMSADVRSTKLMQDDMTGSLKYLVQLQEAHERRLSSRDAAQAEFVETVVSEYYHKTRQDMEQCLQWLVKQIPERIRQDISAKSMTSLLEQQAEKNMPLLLSASFLQHRVSPTPSIVGATSPGTSQEPLREASEPTVQRGTDVKLASAHFEDYFDWDRVYPFTEGPRPPLVDIMFASRLRDFTITMQSQIMYVQSQNSSTGLNPIHQTMAEYISRAREKRIPVVSYFCDPSAREVPYGRSAESMELCALLYSLIRQLIQLVPAELPPSTPPLHEQILALDGTLRTWEEGLELLGSLVRCLDVPLLLFIVDGVNTLEDEELQGSRFDMALRQLITCLEALTREVLPGDRMIKVLFTTTGPSQSLCDEMDERDIVACNMSNSTRKNRRGRQPLAF
ncbi:hypothetical protein B0I35DRAFT_476554 [Stachybotrys elegans]|uniref:DUF7708 domain-containing protein n=1 Tax=Stachybotrys elegans TaxID=80388 RepID=A0A8K0WSV8_9HYPO|nr:hypothetical protein B0I35DRAFT_476554 [Stachybotrys elegans]